MTQHTDVALPELAFNRTDYTALRAYVQKIPVQRIADLYYTEDSPQVEQGLERWLIDMRNALIERAIEHNPAFAEILKGARQGGAITKKALDILITAADLPKPTPSRAQPVAQLFRPKTARSLKDEGIKTLGDLVDLILRRGPGWWRSIPRIGAGRAGAIMRWLHQWPDQLGEIDLGLTHPAAADNLDLLPVLDTTRRREVAPLGTFQLPTWLSGTDGVNRAPAFCFISARNDLEAVNAYLNRYKGQDSTERAYRKELERFILWCALVACKPMSSLLVDDCELYKHFLRAPLPEFRGKRTVKTSKRWRPFALEPMDAESQKYAVRVLRAMFDWLVKVRYLAGNPWIAVKDPIVTEQVEGMQIDRALSTNAWDTVVAVLSERGLTPVNRQDRVALASILLMGDSGLRRAEAAGARRHNLKPSRHAAGVWMLIVLGKRSKMRRVPVSPRTIEALRAHWRDRGLDFDSQPDDLPLVAPVVVPGTETARARHETGSTNGYNSSSIYNMVAAALQRVQKHVAIATPGEAPLLTPEDLAQLEDTSPHAFRHTFGTQAVDEGMPLQVAQDILGHASASTTAIYVKAKEKRIAEAAEDYYNRKGPMVNGGKRGAKE
ncbi:tyrosine-type recombinase/integrase (plasmid) [Massilia forsythiae]|uniref:Tyrosine-type recombinase/integrase n=1 Tax=Massilia forsythiae TaxID=2728020 RepID=A0A7Z2ZVL5_9BURK|nr:phage integrase family protein [Massilia forsythiae]QJE03703.1 tyrosine-type recombinase/integrase [Massilia forsythiae]